MLVVSQRWKDELSLAYETALQIIMKKVLGMTDKKARTTIHEPLSGASL